MLQYKSQEVVPAHRIIPSHENERSLRLHDCGLRSVLCTWWLLRPRHRGTQRLRAECKPTRFLDDGLVDRERWAMDLNDVLKGVR